MRFTTRTEFHLVPINAPFEMQRTMKNSGDPSPITWLKVSTRTARANGNGAVFYFRKSEVVWLEDSYAAEKKDA